MSQAARISARNAALVLIHSRQAAVGLAFFYRYLLEFAVVAGVLGQQLCEGLVEPTAQCGGRAEVPCELEHLAVAVLFKQFPYAHELLNIRPFEPVYRLLRVAHYEQSALSRYTLIPFFSRLFCCQIKNYLGLYRVGILKFVHQKTAVSFGDIGDQSAAVFGVLTQHVAQIEQLIVEGQFAQCAALFGDGVGRSADKVHRHAVLLLGQIAEIVLYSVGIDTVAEFVFLKQVGRGFGDLLGQ